MTHFFKLFSLVLFTIFSNYVFAQKVNLAGNWTNIDYDKNKSDFILSEDNYVSMSVNGEFIDGKNYIIKGGKNAGQKGELKYTIDYDKNPVEIDIIAIMDDTEKGRILGTIKLINKDEFLMIFSFTGKRDFNFSEKNAKQIAHFIRKKS
ncbi:hypothetical protein EIB75_04075 [Epilithonimonas vandammei]|uniref:TIGR03067 domain-containing protein n=1 Tax=Epilithonimonas vandammei TaxID=2487072 RepID=A0A3G8ZBD0_9FLAO|nr:hypothetical protein [Epilithonimonas vandammei]AZI54473.1 hypothetical protein EIB75_04075 [Epilithonimonas vandammei]